MVTATNKEVTETIEWAKSIIDKMDNLKEDEYLAWMGYWNILFGNEGTKMFQKNIKYEKESEDYKEVLKVVNEKFLMIGKVLRNRNTKVFLKSEPVLLKTSPQPFTPKPHSHIEKVFDPEEEIMRALRKGKGDLYGF